MPLQSIDRNTKITVKYNVDMTQRELNNVNLLELVRGLTRMSSDSQTGRDTTRILNNVLLKEPDYAMPQVDKWIAALAQTYTLTVSEDTTCTSSSGGYNFWQMWWQSSTAAGAVLCLVMSVVASEKKKHDDAVDAEIRRTLQGSTGSALVLPSETQQKAVDLWIQEWNAKHHIC